MTDQATTRIGIDLGGTKIEIIALDRDGNETYRRRIATPKDSYQKTIDAMATLVRDAEAKLGVKASVGVGTPGSYSRATGMLRNANSTCLNNHFVDRDLGSLIDRKVRIANDANCFALSEAVDGSAVGANLVFGVIIGTGTGGGIVMDGRVIEGINGIAGEWGHNALPWPSVEELPGPPCHCGKRGCIETYLSGTGLARDHREVSGEPLKAPEVTARAQAGDANACATLERYMDRMARSLANVINLLDPEVVVLGGGVSNLERIYDEVPRLWQRHVFSDRVDTRLVRARHGDSSGVRGAAWLWPPNPKIP